MNLILGNAKIEKESELQDRCYGWLSTYSQCLGEFQPDSEEIHLPEKVFNMS